mmetsp:Transcript_53030/g.113885  ORF Transcript_53030/g.113885 Transcript_53030/m.113885 type:complete len:281 (-) Transcript_53030:411-1253(-)
MSLGVLPPQTMLPETGSPRNPFAEVARGNEACCGGDTERGVTCAGVTRDDAACRGGDTVRSTACAETSRSNGLCCGTGCVRGACAEALRANNFCRGGDNVRGAGATAAIAAAAASAAARRPCNRPRLPALWTVRVLRPSIVAVPLRQGGGWPQDTGTRFVLSPDEVAGHLPGCAPRGEGEAEAAVLTGAVRGLGGTQARAPSASELLVPMRLPPALAATSQPLALSLEPPTPLTAPALLASPLLFAAGKAALGHEGTGGATAPLPLQWPSTSAPGCTACT